VSRTSWRHRNRTKLWAADRLDRRLQSLRTRKVTLILKEAVTIPRTPRMRMNSVVRQEPQELRTLSQLLPVESMPRRMARMPSNRINQKHQ
jgi:hypothetical protein